MQIGALAFLDCLGFKGIWERHSSESIIQAFRLAKAAALRLQQQPQSWFPQFPMQTQFAFLSDTIVIGVYANTHQPLNNLTRGALVLSAAMFAGAMQRQLLKGSAPLALRGCISFGEFLIDTQEQLILGKAVDYTASHERLANGPFIWISPEADEYRETIERQMLTTLLKSDDWDPFQMVKSAWLLEENAATVEEKLRIDPKVLDGTRKDLRNDFKKFLEQNKGDLYLLRRYPMPIKGGETLRCTVVNPFCSASPEVLDRMLADFMGAMPGNELDVVIKRQHLRTLFSEAASRAAPLFGLADRYRFREMLILSGK